MQCKHGYASSSPEEKRICVEFIEVFQYGYTAAIGRGVKDTEEKYAKVWNDVTMMEKIVSYLLCNRTTHILDETVMMLRPERRLSIL